VHGSAGTGPFDGAAVADPAGVSRATPPYAASASAAETPTGDGTTKQAAKKAAKSAKQASKAERSSGAATTPSPENAATANTGKVEHKGNGKSKDKVKSKGEPPGKAGKKPAKQDK
jgi:hypothetical protein